MDGGRFLRLPGRSIFRIRFMPSCRGRLHLLADLPAGRRVEEHSGTFHATDGHRRGPIRVDPQYRWHFIWEGTGEHYFFNGTTAYWLMGWKDERIIRFSLERLHRLKVNRLRVLLAGRQTTCSGANR